MTIKYYDNISGDVYEIPGRSVRLDCANAIVYGCEELQWRYGYHKNLLVAKGVYVDGNLTDATYYSSLAGGRAELAPDGSLIIHSYEDRDAGVYLCYSEYRSALSNLMTFGM